MSRERELYADWDDIYEAFPDWEGPTHSQPIPGRPVALWRPPACRHWREPVDLQDGITVFASGWFDRPARQAVDMDWPDVGFYLDGSWSQTTMMCSPGFRPRFARYRPSRLMIYPWPDLDVPREPARFRRALQWLLRQANEGKRIEIGCAGGHGRTGATLAGLLILQGMSATRAIKRVRSDYCPDAIETQSQTKMLQRLA
jgi:hypothetical protein